jgi:hypothetical protein
LYTDLVGQAKISGPGVAGGRKLVMKEWHRTVLLVVLLAIGIGFLIWMSSQYSSNFESV